MKRQILIGLIALLFSANCLPNAQAQIGGKKLVKVNVILLDNFESENLSENFSLFAVEREVSAASPLRSAIEAQLDGATDEENSQALYSPADGIKLISVRVKNKTAYASFKRTSIETFNKIDALRFKNAVTKTARQFPSVRRIEICLDGNLNFDRTSKGARKPCR